jgi:cytochrome c551/c552
MKRAAVVFLACAGCAAAALRAEGPEVRQLADESRRVADQIVQQTQHELTRAMEVSGPLRAIIVSKYSMPEISSSLSRKTGWKVSLVALKPRNPALGMPDAWERKVLREFEARLARGEKPETVERSEIVSENGTRYFRFMKALPVTALCMNCHGPAEQLGPAVKALLAVEYPHDRAIGYRLGQVRGAATVKRPLD